MRISPRMPAEPDARREVLGRIGQGLPVIAKPGVDRKIVAQMYAVLDKSGQEPLRQLVATDPKVDRLGVVLHICQRQLTEGRSGGVLEGECAEYRGAGFAAGPARSMMDHASAKTKIVSAERPGQRVRELPLVTKYVRRSRLSNGEGH